MNRLLAAVFAFLLSLCPPIVLGQTYPAKPVRIVVPFAPGGGTDVTARMMAKQLTGVMGQSIFVENRPGAEGAIGTDQVAKSPADGYTLLVLTPGFVIGAALQKDLPYNSRQDLVPVAFIGEQPLVLVIGTKVGAKNAEELLQLARAKPGDLAFATTDPSTNMAMEMLRQSMKVDFRIVPYKGGGQAVTDILGGHITGVITSLSSVRQQMTANTIRGIAVTTSTRSPSVPELPTLTESIAPGYEFPSWFVLLAPRATPRPVLQVLNKAVQSSIQGQETADFFATMALRPVPLGIDETQARLSREFDKWEKFAASR